MITIRGWAVNETDKAVLFVPVGQMDRPVWLPRSQITITDREWDYLLTLPRWLAENNGIRVLPPAPRGQSSRGTDGNRDRTF